MPKRYVTEVIFKDSQENHDNVILGGFDRAEINKDGELVGVLPNGEHIRIAVRNQDGTWCAGKLHPPDGYDNVIIYGTPPDGYDNVITYGTPYP